MRKRKFRRRGEPAMGAVEGSSEGTHREREHVHAEFDRHGFGACFQACAYLFADARRFLSIAAPYRDERLQHAQQAGAAETVVLRKIRAGIKRRLPGRHENSERPASAAHHGLAHAHVHVIDVGAFLPVHFDRHEMLLQIRGDLGILKRFVFHHMAPVAGGIADGEENRLVLTQRLLESLGAPWIPVDRIARMLQEVGTGRENQPVVFRTAIQWKCGEVRDGEMSFAVGHGSMGMWNETESGIQEFKNSGIQEIRNSRNQEIRMQKIEDGSESSEAGSLKERKKQGKSIRWLSDTTFASMKWLHEDPERRGRLYPSLSWILNPGFEMLPHVSHPRTDLSIRGDAAFRGDIAVRAELRRWTAECLR